MKLVIQIPCLNEAEDLPETLAALPRKIDGIDTIGRTPTNAMASPRPTKARSGL